MARKPDARAELKRGLFFGAGSAVGGLVAVLLLAWLLAQYRGEDDEPLLTVQQDEGAASGCWP